MNAAFDQTLALEDQTFAGLFEYAEDDCALYDEYLRGFDDVPTLTDPVAVPPPRILPPEFRLGERKDFRKKPREDADTLREVNSREREEMYREYLQPATAKPQVTKSKDKKKSRRRKK
jgi:hypothetical protein